ncbi:type VII secretion target [Saccharopolyspora hattusasensis]|uniref:type VII secretion target n=1 Tax=Saccharopolyspora hattusasensis TaxID=1128679 RepID=UPI003D966264
MGFHVEYPLLRDCAAVMTGDSESAFVAVDYARVSVNLDSQAGVIFANVADRHREVTEAIGASFSHLTGLLSGAGRELQASADVYQRMDEEQAEQLDQKYPQ